MRITGLTIKGDSNTEYQVTAHAGGVLYCTCPAWKFQKSPQSERTCKHIKFAREQLLAARAAN